MRDALIASVARSPIGRAVKGLLATTGPDDERARRPVERYPEALVYELLDAHADTADLAAELRWEPRWAAHLDYLRALQRTGRETLAQMAEDQA